jgi:hypothetical protein
MTARVPFTERGGALRGLLDLATGCYPAFLFGGSCKAALPVFHFHEVARDWLEPRLQYLAENRYRSVACDEIARFVIDGISPGSRAVALTFDDAWTSVWTVALPLLRRFGLRAIVFAIPGRIEDAPGVRPTIEDPGSTEVLRQDSRPRTAAESALHSGAALATWPELRAMHDSGVVDIQSHTRSHAMIFAGDEIAGFVTPSFAREPLLNRPVAVLNDHVEPIAPDALGTPLYVRRSRMSDARRYFADPAVADRCRDRVARNGGPEFFSRPGWENELRGVAAGAAGTFESDEGRLASIRKELADGRALLNEKLGTTTVRDVALPWGIAGSLTEKALADTGHRLAFAQRPLQRHGIHAGDNRYRLSRLNGKYVTCLPGHGRRWFLSAAR